MLEQEEFDQLEKLAIESAKICQGSPLEWEEHNLAMARYCLEVKERLALWRWLADRRLMVMEPVERNPAITQWFVMSIDQEGLGNGYTPEEAIQNTMDHWSE